MKILLITEKKHEILYKNGIFHFSPGINTYRDDRLRNMVKLLKNRAYNENAKKNKSRKIL